MKLLLTSVFGPFGVDDQYGRRLNVMELFHNQVTREQGLFSLRMNHPSFGLYMIAENLQMPTVVLDFPSLQKFIKEVRHGYDYIGISFIVANFAKAKKMVEIIRHESPSTKIILGGHGINIPDLQGRIDCDYISSGEGVSWFRRLFGEDCNKPIKYPAMHSTIQRRVMGIPLPNTAAVLIPGLGCVNACSFCATSHHFGKQYVGYMNSGQEVFWAMQEIERKLGVNEFFVMDENFLKHRPRAEQLLQEMERHNKYFYLGVFSSAETIRSVGVEFMAKLGIDFVWIGVESKAHMFQKTKGVDLKSMIKELRDHGIQVLGSAILFMEHHTKENMQEDIDFVIDLNTDFVQFMNLGPLPGTALFAELAEQDRIVYLPWPEWHGQDKIWFKHPHFTVDEAGAYTKYAFKQDYDRQGPSLLRLAETALRGYRTVKQHKDKRIRGLYNRMRKRCLEFRPLFRPCLHFAQNEKTREMAMFLIDEYRQEFGPENVLQKLASAAVHCFAYLENKRYQLGNCMRQPPMRRTYYRMPILERLGLLLSSRAIDGRQECCGFCD